MLDKRAVLQLGNGLLQLGLGVHHDRPVPGDRLLDRLARDQQEADALVARLHRDLIAAVEYHERAVSGPFAHYGLAGRAFLLRLHAERLRGVAESPRSLEDIGESMPIDLDGQGLA